jgi:glycosyltransferase involved in cell wall biosynthesis
VTIRTPEGGGERRAVAYVIGTYPLLTTTFIDREIALLRGLGVDIKVVSLRRPHGRLSPEQQKIAKDVEYVLPVSIPALAVAHARFIAQRPVAFFGALWHVMTRPHPSLAMRFKTLLHFGEAVQVADILRRLPGYGRIHAHFVDRAATVAMVAGRLLDRPYSVTAHANDIYVNPVMLGDKLVQADFVATCTEYNAAHLRGVCSAATDKILCIHHGLDVHRYEPPERLGEERPAILAVGQLKEKKGLTYLLEACAELRRRGHDFVCDIIGEGPLRPQLEAQVRAAGLDEVVTLHGALDHGAVIEHYRTAAVFALPCITAEDGDRDGIPNVILEAMAMELPVVSTSHSGIPEAVDDGISGLLVPQRDVPALTDALDRLLGDATGRRQMGEAGRDIAIDRFDVFGNVKLLMARMGV